LRSGTSIGANLAEGQGAQSDPDFLTKLSISLKETYETQYWLELIMLANVIPPNRLNDLKAECDELAAIFTSIVKKLKDNRTTRT
jgi:four helix bundle protein